MRKVVLIVIAVMLLVCSLAVLCACESYKADPIEPVGDKDAPVESNGGLVVKQGKYLYFVNGYVESSALEESGKTNWFGNVQKGAIYRVTLKDDGALGDDYTVVVPKTVTASASNVGFSIYGEWIYYVSPSAEEDRSGKVQVDTLQFLRTKIDGTDTQLILEVENTSVEYKYTATALLWYDNEDGTIYSKALDVKKFKESDKGEVIAEKASSVSFIKNPSFDPKNPTTLADYVLYTKASDRSYEETNSLYVSDPLGKENKLLIGATSYAANKYKVSVVATDARDGKLNVYYTKTSYTGVSSSSSKTEGTFAYVFDKSLTFAEAKEIKLDDSALSSLTPIEGGVVSTGSNATIYYLSGEKKTFGDLDLNGSLLSVENGCFYYLNSEKKSVLCYALDDKTNARLGATLDNAMMSSFTGWDYLDGYIYFISDDDYDYPARLKLSDIDFYAGTEAKAEQVALVTDADKEAMEKAAGSEEESSSK